MTTEQSHPPQPLTGAERSAEFNKLYQEGIDYTNAGQELNADLAFAKAATFAPDKWCDVATKLAKRGEESAAMDHFRIALTITPHRGIRSGIYNNIATLYAKHGQLERALEMLDLALKEDGQSPDALCNYGQVRKWQGNLDASDRYCRQALEINPWHSEAQFLQALNALDRGDYRRGFELYECRWRSNTNGWRKLEAPMPEWSGPGSSFNGIKLKRLFVYGEQGAGDILLMLRYAPLIRAAGMWQSWAVKPRMSSLLSGFVDHVTEDGTPPMDFDCHIPSASLPYIFKTSMETVPPSGYLPAPEPMDFGPGFHVGISWRGNSDQYNDSIRSTNLKHWKPVLALSNEFPRLKFHSLQVDGALEAMDEPAVEVHDPPADWLETARRIAGLDLVITVDTGVLHLAGAMNCRAWCALHCRPYFVYPLACSHTPWYSSVRLFKQKQPFQWQAVFTEIANNLRLLLA